MAKSRSATTQEDVAAGRGRPQCPTLLHEQVAVELLRAIAHGEVRPGDRLPQAKDLAAVLGVNTNTVLRALRSAGPGIVRGRERPGHPRCGHAGAHRGYRGMGELIELGRRSGYGRGDLAALLENFSG